MNPEIRFKNKDGNEYPGWKEESLENIAARHDNLRIPITAGNRRSGHTPYYGANGIQDYVDGFTHDGEFILVAEDGANNLDNYPVQYINGKAWVNNHAHVLQGKQGKAQTKFLQYAISHLDMRRVLVGGDRTKLTANVLMHLYINMPNMSEQNDIAQLFSFLDEKIKTSGEKVAALQNAKAAMLDGMFPKDGESVPRIRFDGFTDPWEQRKVGDFLTESKIPGHTGADAKKLTVKLWGKGVVEKADKISGSENTQYYVRSAGQFMYGKLDFLHAAFGIVPQKLDKYESTLDSPAFDLHGIDGQFLLNRVLQQDFYLRNGMVANGSRKAKRIHEDTFLNMDLLVPSYAEQHQIGTFFSNLDTLITLHQRECQKWKDIKTALLQHMF